MTDSPEITTLEQATEVARQAIVDPDREFVLLEDKTTEHDFGWVFYYDTRAHAETGDPGTMLPGVGPFVVPRDGGEPVFLTTSMPPPVAIAEYERQWREAR